MADNSPAPKPIPLPTVDMTSKQFLDWVRAMLKDYLQMDEMLAVVEGRVRNVRNVVSAFEAIIDFVHTGVRKFRDACETVESAIQGGRQWINDQELGPKQKQALQDIEDFIKFLVEVMKDPRVLAKTEMGQKWEKAVAGWRELASYVGIGDSKAGSKALANFFGTPKPCLMEMDGNPLFGFELPLGFNELSKGLEQFHSHESQLPGLLEPKSPGLTKASLVDTLFSKVTDSCSIGSAFEMAQCNLNSARGTSSGSTRRDPLILDLEGDGIAITDSALGVYFDHQGDGFQERSAWVNWDDALLVMDRNGDGKINDDSELFGDQTILKTGVKASDGFQALAELDDNHDGKIDASDKAFSQLKLWKRETGENGASTNELIGLSEAGVESINIESTPLAIVDTGGSGSARLGSFQRTDGTTGMALEYGFETNRLHTAPTEWLPVPCAALFGSDRLRKKDCSPGRSCA